MIKGDFIINGVSGITDLNSVIEKYPNISMPKRKKTFQSVFGANRQVIEDEDAYDNRSIDLSIILHARDEEERTMRLSALYSAFDSSNYLDFYYYGEPQYCYKVTNSEIVSTERIVRMSYYTRVTIKLSAEAFKYYNQGEEKVVPTTGATFFNRFKYESAPLIRVNDSGDIKFFINDQVFLFHNIPEGGCYIDCDEGQQDVYDLNDNLINDAYDVAQEFPKLPSGEITIKGANLNVMPRFRTL
ncbi:phage tail domain-containing protein [Lactobacillus terrae]|uniref:phage tail domain-containing protein n=1 Tax=Lactobacillus terrae TaxID=2269374 RepID=UPI000C1B7ACD|nr:phage tail domain-containing protein [Lactobacillus terrae]